MSTTNNAPDSRTQAPKAPEAESFLMFIDPDATTFGEPFVFQVYDDNKTRNGPARTLIGTLDQHIKSLSAANRDGYAVHATINDTAGKARRAENVVKVRKHFVEIDGTMRRDRILKLAETVGLKPAWINESSTGKYHVYFNVADDVQADLAGFTRRQKQLAKLFSGGRESVDLSRVLRIPGFYHNKGKPFLVRCVHRDTNAPAHTIANFERALAGIEIDETPLDGARAVAREEDDVAVAAAIEHFKTYAPAISNTPSGKLGKQGNSTTYDAMVIAKDIGVDKVTCLDLALEHYNPRCEPPWSLEELQAIVRNAYRYGTSPQGSKNPAADFDADPFTEADELALLRRVGADAKNKVPQRQSANGRGIGDNSKAAGLVVLDMDRVKSRNVDFIWPGRLAKGKHTALAGIGGIGKSQITIDIMARITKGTLWPDSKEVLAAGWPKELARAPQGYCIVLSAEDDPEDTILPRLIAAGGDPKFLKFLSMVRASDGSERKFNLQTDLAALKEYCTKLAADTGIAVQLIVIDPASSYMGGDVDASKNTKVRHVLDPITKLAQDLQCSILSITHFRKGTSAKAVDSVMDSVAFVNAPRAAFGVYNDPSDVGDFNEGGPNYVMVALKTNLPGERPTGLSYRIEKVLGGSESLRDYRTGKPIITSRVVWQGKSDLTADQIAQMEGDKGTPKLDEARRFLIRILPEDEPPKLRSEVMEEAEAEGLAPDTVLRAKRALKVKAKKTRPEAGAPWVWFRGRDLDLD